MSFAAWCLYAGKSDKDTDAIALYNNRLNPEPATKPATKPGEQKADGESAHDYAARMVILAKGMKGPKALHLLGRVCGSLGLHRDGTLAERIERLTREVISRPNGYAAQMAAKNSPAPATTATTTIAVATDKADVLAKLGQKFTLAQLNVMLSM
jgi:hypothetical protein